MNPPRRSAKLTGEILKVIRDLAEEHMTMVIVTHEMSFAKDVADRVIFMAGGVIVEEGTPEEVMVNTREERHGADVDGTTWCGQIPLETSLYSS